MSLWGATGIGTRETSVIQRARLRRRNKISLVGIVLLLIVNVVAAPFVVLSMIDDLRAFEEIYSLTPEHVHAADSYTYLRLEALQIDDVNGSVTLRVSGNHICNGCTRRDRITFYSIADTGVGRQRDGIPPSAQITLPASADTVTQKIELPVHGSLIRYPFDRYRLWLGVTFERLNADGSVELLDPDNALGHLFLEMRNGLSRIQMTPPITVDAELVQPARVRMPYAEVHAIEFYRPVYLRIITPLLIVLVAVAALFAVAIRPFNELIINSGALILGIWSIRALLLGSYPPNTTIVDGVLTLLIMCALCVICLRSIGHLRRAEPPAATP